jgi:hypothetical protein
MVDIKGPEHLIEDQVPRPLDRVVVVGGGCYGSYYVRQIQRAVRAGALRVREIVVVDRDGECAVARSAARPAEPWVVSVRVHVQEWSAFFASYLGAASAAARDRSVGEHDAIGPSPLMPHLMGEWHVERARARWPDRPIDTAPLEAMPSVPWERAGTDGTHYVSFATWTCPVNCIEPRVCPHTRGDRTWSMPVTIERYARDQAAASPAVLFCRHRAFGVGMFDTADVVAADQVIARAGASGAADVIIGTVSHCHGALTRLRIAAPPDATPRGAGRLR